MKEKDKSKQNTNDCGCGKPLSLNDPRKKQFESKKIIKKRKLI